MVVVQFLFLLGCLHQVQSLNSPSTQTQLETLAMSNGVSEEPGFRLLPYNQQSCPGSGKEHTIVAKHAQFYPNAALETKDGSLTVCQCGCNKLTQVVSTTVGITEVTFHSDVIRARNLGHDVTIQVNNRPFYFAPSHQYTWEAMYQWPDGNFCIYRGPDDICPKNFEAVNRSLSTQFENFWLEYFCCKEDGHPDKEVDFYIPGLDKFCFFPGSEKDCQQIWNYGMIKEKLKLKVYTNDTPELRSWPAHTNFPNNLQDLSKYEYFLDACCYVAEPSNVGWILACVFGVLAGAVFAFAIPFLRKRFRRKQRRQTREAIQLATIEGEGKSEDSEDGIGSLLKMILDGESQMTIYGLLIPKVKIETKEKVGKGAFGTVYQGMYRPDGNPLHVQDVAIKTLKENCVYPEISAFVEEAIVMADFQHANVLGIIGVCVDPKTGTPSLVLPFMQHGDLQKYLRQFRHDETKKDETPELIQLLSFCLHIARGMAYLSNMKFVHRDLAARNCMLDSHMVVKVADFGLTRDIYSNSYYRQDKNKLLPIKWMSIESLQDRVFSTYTDVWSYGVTLWEIFTLGKVPYPNLENVQVLPELEKGERLGKPDTCPDKVYEMMLQCWSENPKERPTFSEICQTVEGALSGLCEYLDLDNKPKLDVTSGVISTPRAFVETEVSPAQRPDPTPYQDYRHMDTDPNRSTHTLL